MCCARRALYKISACLTSKVAQTTPPVPENRLWSLMEISMLSCVPKGRSGMALSLNDAHETEIPRWRRISPSGLNIPILLISFKLYGVGDSSLASASAMAELFQ